MSRVVARITARVWKSERYNGASVLDGVMAVRKMTAGLLTAEPTRLECGAWYVAVMTVPTPHSPTPRRVGILYTPDDTAAWCAGWECAHLADVRMLAAQLDRTA